MLIIFLYVQSENSIFIPFIWGFGILLLALFAYLAFKQFQMGRHLKDELVELEKVRKGNIEYEFVLKAMKLSTWHIDPKLRVITFDSDFRQGQDNYCPVPNTPIDVVYGMIAKSDCQRVMNALDDICMGRSNFFHQQYQVVNGMSGATFWEESYATIADRDAEGNPTSVVGTSMRIDEQKKMEVALINARNKAEESDRLKTAFLANMGHEIRTPLNAIVGFSDLLPIVESEEERNMMIEEIRNNNRKLLQIIDGLVSMSKIEAEAKNMVKSQTDIVPLLKQIAGNHSAIVDKDSVAVVTKFPCERMLVNTDVQKLTEIVNNLMQNAVKFTFQGSIILGFDLPEDDHIRIWVKDTGKGIADSDKDRIFERFVKIEEYVPGAGLGLSVVKSHVESLGGVVGVDSHLNEGSTFWFELPIE